MSKFWKIADYAIALGGLFIVSHGLEVLGAVKTAPDSKDAIIAVCVIVVRAGWIYFVGGNDDD